MQSRAAWPVLAADLFNFLSFICDCPPARKDTVEILDEAIGSLLHTSDEIDCCKTAQIGGVSNNQYEPNARLIEARI